MSRPRVIPTVRSGATVQVQVQPRASASVRLWPGPQGPQGPVGPQGPPGAGVPANGLPVVATNVMARPNPSASNPWSVFGTTGTPQVSFESSDPEMALFARFTATGLSTDVGLQWSGGTAALVTGRTYTITAHWRNTGPSPLSVRLGLSAGATPNLSPYITVPNDGVWRRYSHTFTVTGTVGQFRPILFSAAGSTSGTIDVARANVTDTAAAIGYFDGDSPGARWTGAAGSSTSELVATRLGDVAGAPGVADAVAGTRDTGWRNIATLLQPPWIVPSGSSRTGFQIRRIGSLCILAVDVTPSGADANYNSDLIGAAGLPAGFVLGPPPPGLATQWIGAYGSAFVGAPNVAGAMRPVVIHSYALQNRVMLRALDGGAFVAGQVVSGYAQWFTNSAWPTTLPGT